MRRVVGVAVNVRKAASVVARRGFADVPGGSDSNLTPVPPSSRPPATNNESSPAASDPWTPVVDPKTGGTYYWNKLTNETTMVNEPKPVTMYRQPAQQPPSMGGMGSAIMQSFAVGAGVSLAFGLFRVFF